MSDTIKMKLIIIKTEDILDDYSTDIKNISEELIKEEIEKLKTELFIETNKTLDERFEDFFKLGFIVCQNIRHTEIRAIAEADCIYEELRKVWKLQRYLKSFINEKINENKFKVILSEDAIKYMIKYVEECIKVPTTLGKDNERVFAGLWFKKHLDSLNAAVPINSKSTP